MKTGLANFCNYSQLPLSNSLFTVLFAYVFFLLGLWLEICVEVDVDRITILPPPPLPPPPYFFVTHNSLFNTSDSYLKSMRA